MENRLFDIDHRHVETRIVYISNGIFLSTFVLVGSLPINTIKGLLLSYHRPVLLIVDLGLALTLRDRKANIDEI